MDQEKKNYGLQIMIITCAYIIGYEGLATSIIFVDYCVITLILQRVVTKSKLLERLSPYQNDCNTYAM